MDWMQIDIGKKSLYEWLAALAVSTALLILLRLAKWGVLHCLVRRTPKNHWDSITLATAMTRRTLLPFSWSSQCTPVSSYHAAAGID